MTDTRQQLREDVLAYLTQHPGWVSSTDLLPLAPHGRVIVHTEIDETPFGFDDPRGPAYDGGGSGKPDGTMLADVMSGLHRKLLVDMDLPLAYRLYDPEERIGLGEIAERLRVKRDTVDHWRIREVMPEPDPADAEGRRPRWRWRAVRDWAISTDRHPGSHRRATAWARVYTWQIQAYRRDDPGTWGEPLMGETVEEWDGTAEELGAHVLAQHPEALTSGASAVRAVIWNGKGRMSVAMGVVVADGDRDIVRFAARL